MRRSRRKFLRLLGVFVLLVAVLGGVAAAGWLSPFNHWVERRLLAELRVLGVETDAARLRELSWRRAVVGPVELHLPGLTLRAEEARAELGWAVLARRSDPHVVLRGLVIEAQVDRLAELRGALQSQRGGFPQGRLDLEEARVVLRQDGRRLELPFSGYFESRVEGFRAELAVEAPALSGRVSVRGNPADDSVEVGVHDGRLAPEAWRLLLTGVAPEAVTAARFELAARIRVSGTATLAGGTWRAAKAEAELPAFEWRDGAATASAGAGRLTIGAESAGAWRCELRTEHAAWAAGDWSVRLEKPVLVLEPRTARLGFAGGRAAWAGFELAGGGEIAARFGGASELATAEATLRLTAADAYGWNLSAPAEVHARWDGAELGLSAAALELKGACTLQLAELEATVGGLREGSPRLLAQVQVAADVGSWLAAEGAAWRLQPSSVAAKVTLNATLVAGGEGVRAELAVPSQRRALVWPTGRIEAVLGGEAIVNLDRTHISGRTAIEAHEIIVRRGLWSVMAPEAELSVRWPRVWHGALARWGDAPVEQVLRELLWVGDYDGKLTDAVVRGGAAWCATGVGLQVRSRGAEVHETGGLECRATAAELTTEDGMRTTGLEVEATAGLDGGTLKAGFAMPELPIRPTCEQTLSWSDGLEAEGSFGFDPVVLTGKEPLVLWWPRLAGYELSGGVGVNGRSRLAHGEWALSADVILNDFNVRRPAQTLAIEGIRGRVALTELAPLRTAPAQTLTYARAALGAVELVSGSTTFSYEAPDKLSVERWTSGGFGGQLECKAFAFDPRRPELETRLNLKGVQLGRLLKLFENVPAEAEGGVDGSLPLSWHAGRIGFGTGWLRLAPGELGKLHFTRDLKLLTSGRNPGGPGYASLLKVEQSIQTLLFNRLQIDTYPKDSDGQPMRVRLVGAPAGREFDVPVTLDINVNAPLEHFLNWGLGNRLPAPAPANP